MATKYFMNGGVDSNWSSDTNWSTTASSGPNNTTHAVAGDAVLLDAGSPNCVVDASSAAASLVCTGYTGTLTFNSDLTLTSTVTLVGGMTIAGTLGELILNPSAPLSFTTAGQLITCKCKMQGSGTYTMTGNLTVNGLLTLGSGTTSTTINGLYTIYCKGGITFGCTSGHVTGTTALVMSDTGTLQAPSVTSGYLGMSLEFNASGKTITVSGNVVYGESSSRVLTYTAGTMAVIGSVLYITNGCTMNTSGMTWETVVIGSTVTLASNFVVSGNMSISGGASAAFSGAYTVTVGSFTCSGGTNGQLSAIIPL